MLTVGYIMLYLSAIFNPSSVLQSMYFLSRYVINADNKHKLCDVISLQNAGCNRKKGVSLSGKSMSLILFLSIESNAFEKSIKSNMAGRLLSFTPTIMRRTVSI